MTAPRTVAGFREHTIRLTLGPGLSLDEAIDEINSHGRILYRGEAEAAAPALTAEALAEALIECENDGLFGPNYVPIDAAKAILAHLEVRRTLGAQSDD